MSVFDNRLTAIGYRAGRPHRDYWRVERVGPPCGERAKAVPPVRSRALSFWLDQLRDHPGATPYRVCPADETE